jgi:hypothetical protein
MMANRAQWARLTGLAIAALLWALILAVVL